jgi:hypothetical protein
MQKGRPALRQFDELFLDISALDTKLQKYRSQSVKK